MLIPALVPELSLTLSCHCYKSSENRWLSPLLEFNSFVPHLTRHDYFCVLPRLQPFPGQGSRSSVRMSSLTALRTALGKPLLNSQHFSSLQQRCPLSFSIKMENFKLVDGRSLTHLAFYPQGVSLSLDSLIVTHMIKKIEKFQLPFTLCLSFSVSG